MAAVYSTRFFSAPAFNGAPMLQYIVPETFRAVVKTITIVWGDVTASGVDAWVHTTDLCKIARYTWASTLGDVANYGGTQLYYGTTVLDPLEEMFTQTATGTVDIRCSGYLLSLP